MVRFLFTVVYKVDGEKLSGKFSGEIGDLEFTGGKISGDEFENIFDIDGYQIKHKGKLVDGKISFKSGGDYGESEYTMTKAEE